MDADQVSAISAAESESYDDAVYEVEEILAEKWDIWNDDPDQPVFRGVKYLTKWNDYPLHECTWEPKESFSVPDEEGNNFPGTPPILQTWYDRKKSMSESQFRGYCRKNIGNFYEAIASVEKHAKERQRRARPVLSDSDDEGDSATADKLQTRTSVQQVVSYETAADTGSSSSVKQSLAIRKPPLEQSDSSASEVEMTGVPRTKSSNNFKKTAGSTIDIASVSQSRRNATQTPHSPPQSASATATPKPVPKPIRFITAQIKERKLPSRSLKDTVSQNGKLAMSRPTTDGNKRLDKSTAPPSAVTQRKATSSSEVTKTVTSSASLASTEKFAASDGPANVKKVNQNFKINIVNQPKIQQRSEWTHGNKPYSTLHFRAVAQKRSRTEGTPDLKALEIVNDVSDASKLRAPATYDNPYDRREAGRSRLEKSPVREERGRSSTGAGSVNENVPLAPWEVDKIPQVCASWRLSNNCPKTAQSCPFLHRNKDPNGLDYPVSHVDGWIPPKYRKPPLTCPYWLYNKKGCFKPDEQCLFSHRNTGWLQNEKHSGENVVRIDQSILPQYERADGPFPQASTPPNNQKRLGPCDLTCWYWSRGECRNSAETCLYQHYDTGVIARAPQSKEKDTFGDRSDRLDSTVTIEATKDIPTAKTKDTIYSEATSIVEHVPQLTPAAPPPLPAKLPSAKATCGNVRDQISSACKLNFGDMFGSNDSKSETGLMDRRAFLVYHSEEHVEELELITRWLLMHHVQISAVQYAGAWEEFERQIKSGGSGIIIVHPDFEYFTQLPGLGEILRYSVRVWSVGLQEGFEYERGLTEDPPVYRYDVIEIFPVGGFIYITDEVFETEPQLALKIVESFFDKIAGLKKRIGPPCPGREVQDASLLWRLCVRPELMEYLIQDCEQHEAALEAGDADMQSRAQLYALLAETNYIEQDDATEPLSPVFDKHPILSERRIMAESEPMTYFATRDHSGEAANWNMVRYYAGLQIALRRDYRHFFVVHPQPQAACVKQWRQEIKTIAQVLTPRQCVDELRKESEVSMFDFCERFMREKGWERERRG